MTDFSKTIKLPSTQFSMKANLAETENNWIKFWKNNNLYKNLKEESNKFEKFILHDGPPYANGNLHMGHALNKILKDIVCRTKFQSSLDVNYVPGWDCHGLPIEWNIEEKFRKSGKKKNEIDLGVFRNECREFASLWVEKQKEQFSRLGIQSDWSNIYTTMTRSSEVSIVKELLKFLESGELYLGFKPVMWSVVEKTALAEAEVEYKEKISKSIFVKFPVQNMSEDLSIIIWTTTPWTIPCNRAIAYSQELKYKKILILSDYDQKNLKKNDKVIISENLIENFLSRHKIEKFSILDDVNEDELKKFICSHPLKKLGFNFEIRLYPSNHVTDETGSGFVHIAPNHGVEDFEVGLKFGLDNSETVDDGGIYSDNVPFFKGIHVYKADEEVIQQLGKFKNLLSDEDYNHSYPHSWRSKAPLIFRATSQWFISMEKNKLREKAIQEINDVKWIPASSKNRILSMVKERPDWCVSRQRSWGVPITIFISKKSNKPLIDKEVNAKIISKLNELGIDAWFEKPNDFFLTNKYRGEDFIKVDSILDVWFDSGSSHVFVLKDQGLTKKADLYLEGSDQHRGWFQTSLLESC
ncbi:MAG: Isoleucine--tRNA ligase, partial [Alphaproteobacteria bacterium MarineAlpha8_Bin1]